jgi:hypothetical protein
MPIRYAEAKKNHDQGVVRDLQIQKSPAQWRGLKLKLWAGIEPASDQYGNGVKARMEFNHLPQLS